MTMATTGRRTLTPEQQAIQDALSRRATGSTMARPQPAPAPPPGSAFTNQALGTIGMRPPAAPAPGAPGDSFVNDAMAVATNRPPPSAMPPPPRDPNAPNGTMAGLPQSPTTAAYAPNASPIAANNQPMGPEAQAIQDALAAQGVTANRPRVDIPAPSPMDTVKLSQVSGGIKNMVDSRGVFAGGQQPVQMPTRVPPQLPPLYRKGV